MASSSVDDDDLIPKMYSTIDEISRHLHHTGSIISAANCDTNSSTTLHEKTKNKTHLFLHFDVNETILLGDPAGGDSVHECVNKIIAKSAFVSTSGIDDHQDDPTQPRIKRSPSSGNICDTHQFEPTHWWNGMSINDCNSAPPPLYTGWVIPPNTCPFYRTRYKVHAKKFTSTLHGQVYRPLYEKLCLKMGLDCAHADDGIGGESDVQQYQPTSVFKNFLPAFWQTLQYYFPSTKTELSNEYAQSAMVVSVGTDCRRLPPPQKVTLVLRTFGLDLPRVATAISEFAKGNHPDYPTYSNEDLILAEGDLFCSGWSYHSNGSDDKEELVYSLHRASDQGEKGEPVYSGDDDILNFLQTKIIVGIQDNYPFWRENNHAPWAGKPVWTNTIVHGHDHHHVLLDDNIHNDPSDGAGGIRVPVVSENDEDGGSSNNYNRYESLHGQEALDLHGRHLIRVPTIRPSLEDDWFIRQIEMARWLER
ncbi:hypothetical protein ACHAWT_006192 [Skeletonema menzelii]